MSTLKLIGGMGILVLIGAPMVWFLWESLNQLLQGVVDRRNLLLALPVLALFLGYLWFVSRTVRRWDERGAR